MSPRAKRREAYRERLRYFKKQRQAYRSATHRYNVWDGSIRSGKTWGSLPAWIRFIADAPEGDLIMTGKTNGTLYRNVIRPMQDLLGSDFDYSSGKQIATLWDREIFCFGAHDERAEGRIRGMTVAGGYGDEITLWPESYFKQHQGRMSPPGARFFGTTNPDSPYHWFKVDILDQREELVGPGGVDVGYFHFHIDDNTTLDPAYVSAIKREYRGLWYKRFISGLWVLAEGTIYDFFDEDEHVITRPPRTAGTKYHVAIDYGTDNPCVFLLIGHNPKAKPKVWTEREYVWDSKAEGRQKTDSEYREDLKKFVNSCGKKIDWFVIDPSAASFKVELMRNGIYNIKDANNAVLDGIRTQARMLVVGDYAICQGCTYTINEYGAYVWDAKASRRGEDKPVKQNDHTKDAERYDLYTFYGEDIYDLEAMTTT
jgi:PBSX family phage terminase large subunit